MPIYEFRCKACGAKVSLFFRSIPEEITGVCDRCGSPDLHRLMSTFRVLRPSFTPEDINKAELLDGVDYTNPTSMAQMFRRMGDMFQDEPNEHMDEIIGRLEHGEPVEKALEVDSHEGHDHGAPPPVANDD